MNYNKIYDNIINRAKERGSMNVYTEKHHIIPRCMGGNDDKTNLAILTPEEHFVCHQLLVKIYPKDKKLLHAAKMMTINNKSYQGRSTNKLYGWIKRKLSTSKIYKICEKCQKHFQTIPSCNHKKYCSIECAGKKAKKKIVKTCYYCKHIYKVRSYHHSLKYCSRRCYYSSIKSNKFIKTCPTCQKDFEVKQCLAAIKYCSRECIRYKNQSLR